jgi:hypothetical protein
LPNINFVYETYSLVWLIDHAAYRDQWSICLGLDHQASFPGRKSEFAVGHQVYDAAGNHPLFYVVGARDFFVGVAAVGR